MNSEDYVRMSRIEEYNNPLKQAKIDLTKILKDQNNDAAGLDDLWGEGVKMNWQLVPVEKQKPHINWRQAIDDDGSRLGRLASWQDVNAGISPAITNALNNEQKTNVYIENKKAMDSSNLSEEISPYVTQGRKSVENETDQARTDYDNAHKAARDAVGSGNDLDVLAVVAAGTVLATTDYASIVKQYRSVSSAISCSNPAVIWTAYNTSQSIAKMLVDGTLEAYANPKQTTDSKDGKTSTTTTTPKPEVTLIPEPTITEHSYSWSSAPSTGNSPSFISVHHTDGDMTVEKIHEVHRDTNGWSGIGYHFVIYPNGEIHQGRQENMIPAAVEGHNTNSIAISLRGNYNNTEPSDEMWDALISLVAYVCKKYSITASRNTIKGHREFSGHTSNDCPGHRVFARLDDLVNAVSSGKLSTAKAERALWVDFADLYKKGIVKEGTSSPDGMFLFPSICYLYVKLMNDIKSSSFDGDSGWGFPFNEDTINADPEKSVFLTAPFGEERGDHLHEGVDMNTSQSNQAQFDIPFCAVKNGTVIIHNQWCNGIYVKHTDGTYSRYLHCRRHLVQEGQSVVKGQNIGIVGNSYGSYNSGTPHLHIEFGTQKNGDGLERSYNGRTIDCGLNPVDYWRKHTDTEGSYLVWKLS